MDALLLATKSRIPQPPQYIVRRARLLDTLERRLPRHKLALLVAPAGYGKTTLLAQWARASRFRVAWLSIDEQDNDLERFLRYLLASWAEVQPGVADSPLGLLLGSTAPDTDAVLSALLHAADAAPGPLVFVLDEVHRITDPDIQAALTFLLDHLPPTVHLVLAGRGEPPLPLARYRARQELLELRAGELAFSLAETQAFLNDALGLDVAPGEVARLHAQLEGWIAGLQLVALTLQQRLTRADQLVVSSRHRLIADYLSADVLAPLPDDQRRFLLQTSILDRLSGSLCNTVTGRDDGQAMLETLEREALFLAPLDDRREWFRYHALFAGFLREELKRRLPDQFPGLHRRAARWYLAHDAPEQAFDHAVAGDDAALVMQIVEDYFAAKLLGGEIKVVQRWLDALPEAWQARYPTLGLVRAGTMISTGQFDASIRYLNEIEAGLEPDKTPGVRQQQARVTALRCYIACFQNDLPRAEALADQALRHLPTGDLSFRPGVYGALGDTYRRHGRWEDAKACYLQLLDVAHAPVFRVEGVHVFGALADLELRQGHLRQAAGYWRQALGVTQPRQGERWFPPPVTGWVYIRLAEILYEWNDLAEAREHLSRGLQRAEWGGDTRALIAGYLMAGRLELTAGDVETAEAFLERTRPLVESTQFAPWISRFERFQLELWLAQDRLRAAVHWADDRLRDDALEKRPESEVAELATARVLIVKGDAPSVQQALALLRRLLQTAEEEGRTGVHIEGLALQALARWRHGERAAALSSLERALRLAEPHGYVRRFADLGLPMARLLQEAHARHVLPGYVARLLAACGAEPTLPPHAEGRLPEPLTPRERQVLELLAAGLTNREIAEELVISPETAKKHASHIYGKLGVHSRTEAAATARDLNLLP